MKILITTIILFLCFINLSAKIDTVYTVKDSVTVIHYHNGEQPPIGQTGKLVQCYDGCNTYSISRFSQDCWSATMRYCVYKDGQIINTWEKYQITDKLFYAIHEKYIYNDPDIKRW